MAKKPARVFQPGAEVPPPGAAPSIPAPERVQVYKDGANRDRLGITQQVVEHAGDPVAVPGGEPQDTRYRRLLRALYDGMLITDLEGNIHEINARAERYFARKWDELLGENIVPLISGADKQLLTVVRENIAKGKYTVLEAVCVGGEEARFNAEIVVSSLNDKELVFSVRDVTRYKDTEEALLQANTLAADSEKAYARLDALAASVRELFAPADALAALVERDKNEEYRAQLDSILAVLNRLKGQESPPPAAGSEPAPEAAPPTDTPPMDAPAADTPAPETPPTDAPPTDAPPAEAPPEGGGTPSP
jgi:PAS domain S-box-containing protein